MRHENLKKGLEKLEHLAKKGKREEINHHAEKLLAYVKDFERQIKKHNSTIRDQIPYYKKRLDREKINISLGSISFIINSLTNIAESKSISRDSVLEFCTSMKGFLAHIRNSLEELDNRMEADIAEKRKLEALALEQYELAKKRVEAMNEEEHVVNQIQKKFTP